jgi:hypothetical protein
LTKPENSELNLELKTTSDLDSHTERLQLQVEEGEDDTLIISWDDTHPEAIKLGINDLTEEEWVELLKRGCERGSD